MARDNSGYHWASAAKGNVHYIVGREEPAKGLIESRFPGRGDRCEIARFWALRSWNLAIAFLGFPRIAWRDFVAASEGTMRPKQRETSGSNDLFRARLEQIINMKHELVVLAG